MLRRGSPAPLWLLCLAGFLVVADGRIVTPILPAVARDFHTTIGTAGLIATAYMGAYAVFQLGYGPFGDRLGKVRVIRVALLVFTVGTGLCAAMPDLNSLIAMRALTGVSGAAVVPMVLAYLGDTIAYERRQQAISLFLSSLVAGVAVSQVLGGLLAQVASWRSVFVVLAVGAAVPALLFQRAGVDVPEPAEHSGHFQRYREVVVRAPAFYAVCVLEGTIFWGGAAYLGAVIVEERGSSYVLAGLLLGVMGIASIVTARIQGRRSGSGRERQRFARGSAVYGVGTVMIATLTQIGGIWPLWFAVAAALLGVGLTSAHATLQTAATEISTAARGTALSLFSFSLTIGGAAGSAVAGVLIDGPGYPTMFAIMAAGVLLLTVVGPIGLTRRRGPAATP